MYRPWYIGVNHKDLRKRSYNLSLVSSHQFSSTLVLVWPGHESWENPHTNSRFSTIINSHATLVLVWPGIESWENSHINSRFSTIINSHATNFLVWPGHDNRENSHTNSRLSTLSNSRANLILVWLGMRVEKTLIQSLVLPTFANSYATLVLVWPGMKVEKTPMQTLASQLSSSFDQGCLGERLGCCLLQKRQIKPSSFRQSVIDNSLYSQPHLLSLPGCFLVISSLYRFANNINAFMGLRAHEFAFFLFFTRVPLRFTIFNVDSNFFWYSTCSSFLWK